MVRSRLDTSSDSESGLMSACLKSSPLNNRGNAEGLGRTYKDLRRAVRPLKASTSGQYFVQVLMHHGSQLSPLYQIDVLMVWALYPAGHPADMDIPLHDTMSANELQSWL